MNKKLTTADRFPIGEGSYVSPAVAVSEISNEGVLCASSPEASIQEWEDGTINW